MNKPYILQNLKEAREALDQLIGDMQANPEDDFGEFRYEK